MLHLPPLGKLRANAGQMQDMLVAPGSYRGAPLPWWMKIAAKLILSRLPVPHSFWSRLNVFRHSYSSQDADLLVQTISARLAWFRARTGRVPRTVLELGPGEITTCAVVYKALGVERILLADVGDFGTTDLADYKNVAAAAARSGLAPPDLTQARDRADIFARCGADYLTGGLADLKRLPNSSADLINSVAVVEHIRCDEIAATFAELRRILADDGRAWHTIDFQDHLGGKLENLRFGSALWESGWMSNSGFYTNRVSASRIVNLLRSSGLAVEIETRGLWPEPPIARRRIAPDVSPDWSDEDLRTCAMSVSACVAPVNLDQRLRHP